MTTEAVDRILIPEFDSMPEPSRFRTSFLGRRVMHSSFAMRAVLTIALVVLVGIPVVKLIIGSLRLGGPLEGGDWTLQHYREVFTAPGAATTLTNTIIFAVGQTFFPLVIGSVLAWLVTRTDIPGRKTWEYLTVSLYFVPLLASGTAWVVLLGPENGIINRFISDVTPWGGLSVYTLSGMILVQSLYLVPLVFLVTAASFRAVNSDLEDAARVSGSGPWRAFRDVTLGVSRPAVISAGLLCFILGLGSLEIPLLFGFPARINVYTLQIYQALKTRFPPEYGVASAFSVVLLVVGALLLFVYLRLTRHASRFVTVGGQSRRPIPLRLGRTRWVAFAGCVTFFFFSVVLPFGAVAWASLMPFIAAPSRKLWANRSFDNYQKVADNPIIGRAVVNSLILSVGAGIVVMLIGALVAYVSVRSGGKWARGLEFGATLPLAIPATVLATALLFTYISMDLPVIGSIYGTKLVIGLAYVALFIPVATRQVSGAVIQISEDLEHASRVSGSGQMRTIFRIVLPLLLPAMFGGFLLAFITYMREFGASVLLFSSGNEVISVVMYSYYSNGQLPAVAAMSVVLSVLVFVFIWFCSRVLKLRISF